MALVLALPRQEIRVVAARGQRQQQVHAPGARGEACDITTPSSRPVAPCQRNPGFAKLLWRRLHVWAGRVRRAATGEIQPEIASASSAAAEITRLTRKRTRDQKLQRAFPALPRGVAGAAPTLLGHANFGRRGTKFQPLEVFWCRFAGPRRAPAEASALRMHRRGHVNLLCGLRLFEPALLLGYGRRGDDIGAMQQQLPRPRYVTSRGQSMFLKSQLFTPSPRRT